ncbi:hypothetical protein ACFLYB_02870 [Chloroflexota bacterium]
MGKLSAILLISLLLATALINASCNATLEPETITITTTHPPTTSTTTVTITQPPVTITTTVTQATLNTTTNTGTPIPLEFEPSYIIISPDTTNITLGNSQIYTAMGYDREGTIVDVTSETSFSIEKSAGGSWVFNNYTSENTGTWKVTGLFLDPLDGYESWSDSAILFVTE